MHERRRQTILFPSSFPLPPHYYHTPEMFIFSYPFPRYTLVSSIFSIAWWAPEMADCHQVLDAFIQYRLHCYSPSVAHLSPALSPKSKPKPTEASLVLARTIHSTLTSSVSSTFLSRRHNHAFRMTIFPTKMLEDQS